MTTATGADRLQTICVMEYATLAAGVLGSDAFVTDAEVSLLQAGSIHSGKFLFLAAGHLAALTTGLKSALGMAAAEVLDHAVFPNLHPGVRAALSGDPAPPRADLALGVIETATAIGAIRYADIACKAAEVTLSGLRLADGIGGKGFLMLSGELHDVLLAHAAASGAMAVKEYGINLRTVTHLHGDFVASLGADLSFAASRRRSLDRYAPPIGRPET